MPAPALSDLLTPTRRADARAQAVQRAVGGAVPGAAAGAAPAGRRAIRAASARRVCARAAPAARRPGRPDHRRRVGAPGCMWRVLVDVLVSVGARVGSARLSPATAYVQAPIFYTCSADTGWRLGKCRRRENAFGMQRKGPCAVCAAGPPLDFARMALCPDIEAVLGQLLCLSTGSPLVPPAGWG